MTIREWQSLSPAAAAREIHRRAQLLSPAQRRAVFASLATEQEIATTLAASEPAPLARVPYVLKDLFDLAGRPTAAGSTFLAGIRPVPSADAAIVQTLRAAGAACVGQTHLHEFAYGITGENPHYGDCEHPRFPGRTTGGSSSGSAAAVAAGIVPLAVGTDTGGSVRLPAAFCGLFGFRLTPRDRLINDAFPLAPSFDTAGWFTAGAADMKLITGTLCGSARAGREPRGIFLAMPGMNAEPAAACASAGHAIGCGSDPAVESDLAAGFATAPAIYSTIVAAEAWAVHRVWADHHRASYDPAVWQRLHRGRDLPPAELENARAGHAAVRQLWAAYFQTHDFLALPAAPCAALTKAGCTLENRNRILALTTPASLGGCPVLTVPVPLSDGLTTGLQIVVREADSPVVPWILDRISA